jgi:hypothetical protein
VRFGETKDERELKDKGRKSLLILIYGAIAAGLGLVIGGISYIVTVILM